MDIDAVEQKIQDGAVTIIFHMDRNTEQIKK